MRFLSLKILSIFAVALVAVSAQAQDSAPEPVEFTFVAIKASNVSGSAQKSYSKGLESVRRDIASLSYNTFEKKSAYSGTIPFGSKTKIPIDNTYSLIVEPTAVDQQGRIKLSTQVMMKKVGKDGKMVNVKALDTVLSMAPGKKLNLGGLKLKDGGDLLIVLSVK